MREIFGSVTVVDFEYEIAPGGLPNVLCMSAAVLDEHLRLVRTVRMWRGEFGSAPPFDIGPDALIVGYSLWAEMTCFQVLGWKFPEHVFCQHTAYLAASNVLLPHVPEEEKRARKRERKRLSDACRAYGIPGWENIDKDAVAKDIGEGRWRDYGQPAVQGYCDEDVRAEIALLRKQLQGYGKFEPADVPRILHWSEYSAKAIARIQARGMPIDMRLWQLVQENRDAVIAALLRKFDPSYGSAFPIFSPDGHWEDFRFMQWLASIGVRVWPRLPSGKIQIDSDAFKLMSYIPGIANLHALRDSIGVIAKAQLPIGPDNRNRPSLFPFGTVTGRNAHTKSLFNAHAGVRSFMKFPADLVTVYLDWRTQEVGVVAALSVDQALMDAYASGDIYHSLARMCGLTNDDNIKRWKADHKDQRQRMKQLQLGISYGMGVPSLARGLNRHPLIASTVIEKHKRTYPRFWEWREHRAQSAMFDRQMFTDFTGWPMYLSHAPNQRTLYNFPAQGGAAEMLRLGTTRLCEAGIVPSMLVHDGILIEARDDEQVAHALEIMRKAGAEVCNGFEIGVDKDQVLRNGARFRDGRDVAKQMWATIMQALRDAGADVDQDEAIVTHE